MNSEKTDMVLVDRKELLEVLVQIKAALERVKRLENKMGE